MLRVRPILSSLLASKMVSEEEKNAVLDYLGSAETIDEESLDRASDLAGNKEAVLAALLDVMQRHDERPLEEIPVQPVFSPQEAAGKEMAQAIAKKMMGV